VPQDGSNKSNIILLGRALETFAFLRQTICTQKKQTYLNTKNFNSFSFISGTDLLISLCTRAQRQRWISYW